MSHARTELEEQPQVIERLLVEGAQAIVAARAEIERHGPRYAVLVARGSSDNAARYAQHVIGRFWRIPVALATPSLHTLYGTPPRYEGALVIGISQSGASPDVAGVVAAASAQGALTIAVTNEPRSPLAEAARFVIPLCTGAERSVAATKTYTASLAVIAALVAGPAALRAIPDAMARQLARAVPDELAAGWQRVAVLGRGANYGTAFEAALKLSELTGMVAVPWSSADFLHGPIAIVGGGFPVLAFAPSGPAYAGVREVVDAAAARGADVCLVSDTGAPRIELEAVDEWLSPLVAVIPAQQLAVGASERLGRDVDRPHGLQKVTLTS